MMALSFPIAAPQAADSIGRQLEADVQLLLPVVEPQRLKTVFGLKLLARTNDQWIDTVHEVAVSATALGFYDVGTLELEKPIPGSQNNSDTYGLRGGQPFRIDATVIHENWPPPSDPGTAVTA